MFGRAAITLGIGPHSSLNYYANAYNRGRQLSHRKTKLNQIQLERAPDAQRDGRPAEYR